MIMITLWCVYGVNYEDIDLNLTKKEYKNLPVTNILQIYDDYILIMFDTSIKNIDNYQKISFKYDLVYGKSVQLHNVLIEDESSGINKKFKSIILSVSV